MEEIQYNCSRCKDIGWIEEITYKGETIGEFHTGMKFYGYDHFSKTTIGLAKSISNLEGFPLYIEMGKQGSRLNQLTKHDSIAIPCGCRFK